MAKKKRPWEERWRILREHSGGGQGATYIVQRAGASDAASPLHVLKVLQRQTDLERRKRMYREVATMRTLSHVAIPRIIESNADQYETDESLYAVMEYINGGTLGEAIETGLPGLGEALEMMDRLLDVLEYAHHRGFVHRDIKPDNIICRAGNFRDPVLIDFGISFAEANETDSTLTSDGQQLGNRFLHLPELQVASSLKRDPRSDITQCCGVFFYALTGIAPVTLSDHQQQKPHQRPDARQVLRTLPAELPAVLNSIFDTAFEIAIDRRWQSIKALRALLVQLTAKQPQPNAALSIEQKLAAISTSSRSPERSRRAEALAIFNRINDTVMSAVHEVVTRLGDDRWTTVQTGHEYDPLALTLQNSYGIQSSVEPSHRFMLTYRLQTTGNEIVLTALGNDAGGELLRSPLTDPGLNLDPLLDRLIAYYVDGLHRAIAIS